MEELLLISVALLAGLFMSRLTRVLKLPAVTGYLVAGILIGPFFLGRLGITGVGFNTFEQVRSMNLLSNAALGFIAFAIGNEFRLTKLRKTGKQATIVGILQALTATLLVDATLIILHFILGEDKLPISVAITLGAIAAATAPAATLMVVRQYKAKGEVTDILLPVVALDDAVGLVVFAVSFGIAKALTLGQVDIVSIVVNPIIEVVASLVLGAVMGIVFTFAERAFHSNSKRMSLSITFVLLAVAISLIQIDLPGGVKISFSTLLVCMMLGTLFCNICDFSEELMDKTDKWTAPLFVLFFVLSGAELDFSVFADGAVIGIGLLYIIARSAGKYIGAYASSRLSHCSPNVTKYLGITLLPQAGVALGMSINAEVLGEAGMMIRNIVLFGVLIYELVGPTMTKIALMKSGDIDPTAAVNARSKNKAGAR